jgi:hypothetical protein
MPKHPRNHPRKQKPPNTPKKKRQEKAWEIREEDMPHAAEIWKHRIITADGLCEFHYLLLEPYISPAIKEDGLSWTTLCLETGVVLDFWFNFELDDWTRIE